MAILEHFSARVLIDGQACQEYAINKDDGEDETNVKTYPRVINYVEVIPGAHFTVQVTPEKLIEYGTANAISYRLSLDDVLLSSRLVRNEIFTASLPSTGKVMCGQDIEDEFTFRRFIFADVVTRDRLPGDEREEIDESYAELGQITFIAHRVIVNTDSEVKRIPRSGGKIGQNEEIPEDAIKRKVISVHATTDTIDIKRKKGLTTRRSKDVGTGPAAEFVFRYRSKEALQQLHITPRARSPTPLEERPPESLTRDELLELVRLKKATEEASRVKIKQEKKEAVVRELNTIKRSRDDADDETIKVITVVKKKRTEPPTVIELD